MSRILRCITAAACWLLIAGTPTAFADDAGDDIAHPVGPLSGGTLYNGKFDTNGDVDWYVFYTNAQQPLDVAITKTGSGCSSSVGAYLLDDNGESVDSVTVPSNATRHFGPFTTPTSPARYYLRMGPNNCANDTYQLQLTPAASVASSSDLMATAPGSQTTATGEPNDMITQAFGPMLGATAYSGQFDTNGDQDWFFFYTNGQKPIDIAVTKVGPGCSGSLSAYLLDDNGDSVDSVTVSSDHIKHFNFTTPLAPTRYLVKLGPNNCAGDPYQLRVDPATSVTQTPPPPDADKDAVPDASDGCPTQMGPPPSGCPDTDGDGVTDNLDGCVDEKASTPSGCPDGDGDGVPDKSDKCPKQPAATVDGCRLSFLTVVSFKRRGARYSGHLSSTGTGCASSRYVVLRKVGRGSRSFGSTTSNAKGGFTIIRGSRLRGVVYAYVSQSVRATQVCRSGKSRTIRG